MDHFAISTFVLTAVIVASGPGVPTQDERTTPSGLFHNKPGRMAPTPKAEVHVTTSIASTMNSTKNMKEQKMNNKTKNHHEDDKGPQITRAISQFKTQPHDRREPAKKLLPLLKTDTSIQEVEAMLGIPNAKVWDYTLFYSSTLIIRFDNDGRVTTVSSDLLDEVRSEGTRDRDKTDPEIIGAISEFKRQPYNRQKPAKKLLPLVKAGMPIGEVEAMLGPPDGTLWDYSLFHASSSSLIVRFSNEGKVEEVASTGLSEK
jgi:hypothetical protein